MEHRIEFGIGVATDGKHPPEAGVVLIPKEEREQGPSDLHKFVLAYPVVHGDVSGCILSVDPEAGDHFGIMFVHPVLDGIEDVLLGLEVLVE